MRLFIGVGKKTKLLMPYLECKCHKLCAWLFLLFLDLGEENKDGYKLDLNLVHLVQQLLQQ